MLKISEIIMKLAKLAGISSAFLSMALLPLASHANSVGMSTRIEDDFGLTVDAVTTAPTLQMQTGADVLKVAANSDIVFGAYTLFNNIASGKVIKIEPTGGTYNLIGDTAAPSGSGFSDEITVYRGCIRR